MVPLKGLCQSLIKSVFPISFLSTCVETRCSKGNMPEFTAKIIARARDGKGSRHYSQRLSRGEPQNHRKI